MLELFAIICYIVLKPVCVKGANFIDYPSYSWEYKSGVHNVIAVTIAYIQSELFTSP